MKKTEIQDLEKFVYIDEADSALKPRTPNEFAAILAWLALSDRSVAQLKLLEIGGAWRTRTTEFRGHIFCESCDQIIPEAYCHECGLPLPGSLPTIFDLCSTSCFKK